MSWHHRKLQTHRWERVRRFVLERDRYRCVMCGKAGALECDHITPLQKEPGQNPYDPNGLQALCRPCHIEKTRRENRRVLSPQEQEWSMLVNELRP